MSSLGGSCGLERASDLLLVTHQAPKSLSQVASVSAGHLAAGGGVCCSHLPSSALPILISTSGLPLLDLPWRPLWIFPRQTWPVCSSPKPREGGTPRTTLGSKGSHRIPAWEQEAGREQHLTQGHQERGQGSAPGAGGPRWTAVGWGGP